MEEMIEFGEAIAEEIATVEIPAPVRFCIWLAPFLRFFSPKNIRCGIGDLGDGPRRDGFNLFF
jgi:hypothetical protein